MNPSLKERALVVPLMLALVLLLSITSVSSLVLFALAGIVGPFHYRAGGKLFELAEKAMNPLSMRF